MRTSIQCSVFSVQWGRVALPMVLILFAAGCATPPPAKPADPELSRLTSAARTMFERGSPEGAARLYLRALDKARAADDPHEIGMAAYNLGACMIDLEQYEEARGLLKEAEIEFQRTDRETADIVLLDAKALRLGGKYDEAVKRADEILPAVKTGDKDVYRAQAHLLKAQVACDRGEAEWAHKEMGKAEDALGAMSDVMLEAEAAGVAGRVLLLEKGPEKAGGEFDRQAGLYRKAGKHRAMALALGRAGQAYAEANDPFHAGDRFYRSARSLFAQGDDVGALRMLEGGLAAAEKSQDEDSIARAVALFKEIRKRTDDAVSAAAPATGSAE
jgi:tetratricopeptide (TPR) repeat protein